MRSLAYTRPVLEKDEDRQAVFENTILPFWNGKKLLRNPEKDVLHVI